jgi:hypothetical protein
MQMNRRNALAMIGAATIVPNTLISFPAVGASVPVPQSTTTLPFSANSSRVIGHAHDIARELRCDWLGVEHLVVGLARQNGDADELLRILQRKYWALASAFRDERPGLTPTPRLQMVVSSASAAAYSDGNSHIAPKHLWTGILGHLAVLNEHFFDDHLHPRLAMA